MPSVLVTPSIYSRTRGTESGKNLVPVSLTVSSRPEPRGKETNLKSAMSPVRIGGRRSRRISGHPKRLTLAELEALASALLAVLFALFLTRVTAHEAFSLHLWTQLRVELLKCAGDAHADSATLSGDSTATAG